jgi:tetratricopeptide (TPR) repeat protein
MSTHKSHNNRPGAARPGGSNSHQQPKGASGTDEVHRLLNLGADLLEQGQALRALPHLQRARELDATNVVVAINLGGCYIMLGRPKEAIPLLEEAAAVEDDNAMIWMNLGAAYLGNPVLATDEKQERAIGAFRRVLALQPGMPNANYNLGLIFRDQGKWAEALDEFRRALEINSADEDARRLMDSMLARLVEAEAEE